MFNIVCWNQNYSNKLYELKWSDFKVLPDRTSNQSGIFHKCKWFKIQGTVWKFPKEGCPLFGFIPLLYTPFHPYLTLCVYLIFIVIFNSYPIIIIKLTFFFRILTVHEKSRIEPFHCHADAFPVAKYYWQYEEGNRTTTGAELEFRHSLRRDQVSWVKQTRGNAPRG